MEQFPLVLIAVIIVLIGLFNSLNVLRRNRVLLDEPVPGDKLYRVGLNRLTPT